MTKTCKGITRTNKRCKRSISTDESYCWSHVDQQSNSYTTVCASSESIQEAYNDTCPICLENTGHMILLSCNHNIHEECVLGLTSLECPICRNVPVNLPRRIVRSISTNRINRRLELLDEEETALRQTDDDPREDLPQDIISTLEQLSALGMIYGLNFVVEVGWS